MRITVKVLIRVHILRLAEGMPFTTRSVLNYGNRPAVDQVLSRFVKLQATGNFLYQRQHE